MDCPAGCSPERAARGVAGLASQRDGAGLRASAPEAASERSRASRRQTTPHQPLRCHSLRLAMARACSSCRRKTPVPPSTRREARKSSVETRRDGARTRNTQPGQRSGDQGMGKAMRMYVGCVAALCFSGFLNGMG